MSTFTRFTLTFEGGPFDGLKTHLVDMQDDRPVEVYARELAVGDVGVSRTPRMKASRYEVRGGDELRLRCVHAE